MVTQGQGKFDQVEIRKILGGQTQHKVLRSGMDEGTVRGFFGSSLHLQIHARFILYPMALMHAVNCSEPSI